MASRLRINRRRDASITQIVASQYCSHDYQNCCVKHGFQLSMSGKGNCYDNSAVETFSRRSRPKLIWRRSWQTSAAAEAAIFQYINGFYNRAARHSA
jgi:putative transposase